MRRHSLFTVLLGTLTLAPTVVTAQSQTTATLRGTARTWDGFVLPNATVSVARPGTGSEYTTITNAEGRFVIVLLPPGGPYELRFSHIGFAETQLADIHLRVGETRTIDVILSPSAVDLEGIEVAVQRSDLFSPSQVGPAMQLNERAVAAIPLRTRDVMELATLSPLVKTTDEGGLSIGGQNDRYNQLLIDGLSNKDPFALSAGGVPGGKAGAKILPLDAVAQYDVLVAPFDVRLSGFSGGVMNAVTKRGTNAWAFSAFAVRRAEALTGNLTLPTGTAEPDGLDRSLFGFSAGGPIVRDRAHFFVATEFERRHRPPPGLNLGRDDPSLLRLTPESMTAFEAEFTDRLSVGPGAAGAYALGQELANVFARVDLTLREGKRLTLRHIFADATNEDSPNRSTFEAYGLSTNAVTRQATANTTSLQLFTELDGGGGHEMELSVQRVLDATTPLSDLPQIEVGMVSALSSGLTVGRPVRAGAEFYAQSDQLEQTVVRFTNTYTLPTQRRSTYTLGVTGSAYAIERTAQPGSYGEYFFSSVEDLEANAPLRYQRTVLEPGSDPTISVRVLELAAYVQNEIDAGEGLTMHFGIRFDLPKFLDHPERNAAFGEEFTHNVRGETVGFDNTRMPGGKLFVSPRYGFNWQSEARLRTQVRGGLGLFNAQIPYAWLTDIFEYTGLRSTTLVCTGRDTDVGTGSVAPPLVTGSTPETCLRGEPTVIRPVVFATGGFQYPRYLKFSAMVDQELSDRISGTLGFLFTHARHEVQVVDLNIDPAEGRQDPKDGYGDRYRYGRVVELGREANRRDSDFDNVLEISNRGTDWNYSFTGELRGRLAVDLFLQVGYSYARTFDRISLSSANMFANFGDSPIDRDPNYRSPVAANFDRPHKVVASIFGRPFPGLPDTEISLLYTGQSGLPFTYVYRGDYNGDGYPGPGPAFDSFNDAIYVPESATELPADASTHGVLAAALESDACLAAHRGELLTRNACRAPWQHQLDVRLTQALRLGGTQVQVDLDLINALNLIDSSWGLVRTVPTASPLIEPVRREAGDALREGALISRWAGGTISSAEGAVPAEPWAIESPGSQWQVQLGVRMRFGG